MTHACLTDRQRSVLRARCEAGSRQAGADRLGLSLWNFGRILRQLQERCGCVDDAQACWEHRVELEAEVVG